VSTSRALASFFTCATDDQFRTDHLKLSVLWYDEVLFENIGAFDQARFLERIVGEEKNAVSSIKILSDLVVPLDKRVNHDVLEYLRRTAEPGYPRWGKENENYTYPAPENAEQYAHNQLLAKFAEDHGVKRFAGGDVEQAEGRARVAVDAVRLWNHVNRELDCVLQASSDERLVMTFAQKFAAESEHPPEPIKLFELAVPSLSSVPWSRIIELRNSDSLDALRSKIAAAVEQAGNSLEAAKRSFAELERGLIDEIIESGRPNVKKVAFEGLVSNIPGLPFNPAGAYFGVRDSLSTVQRHRNVGWLYLLRDIRAATAANP
jgi:hypothetical protein